MRAWWWTLLGVACAASPVAPDAPADTDAARVVTCPLPEVAPPACGSGPVARGGWLPGPADPGYDDDLAQAARRHDRVFTALIAHPTGVNAEAQVALDAADARAAIDAFVAGDGWDFAAATGRSPQDTVTLWTKVAGAYAGVGIAADALRYATLRDEGAPCAEVEQARAQLVRATEGLLRAVRLPATPGVIARGYAGTSGREYGSLVDVVPLFDDAGAPLPAEKTNGTWRADVSGADPGAVWEDSCSRDMLIGWAAAFGALAHAVGRDPTFPAPVWAEVQAAASAIARSLRDVQDSGYDLEIRDADGRMTFHGILHEESVDRLYLPGARNGQNAVMALGIAAALARAAADPALDAWIADTLVADRNLPGIVAETVEGIDLGRASNYSNHNMAFLGGHLVDRHLCLDTARAPVAQGMRTLYARPGRDRQPIEQGQALYDLVAAFAARDTDGAVDPAALDRVVSTLVAYPQAPVWDTAPDHCDDDEIAAGACLAADGVTRIALEPRGGRNDALIAVAPMPWALRPPSNYHWRSNPYQVDRGGDGRTLLSAVDFRFVYWDARHATR